MVKSNITKAERTKASRIDYLKVLQEAVLVGLLITIFPLVLAFFVLTFATNGFAKKCKYHKVCNLYSNQNELCIRDAGQEQIKMCETEPADCYLKMEEKHERNSGRS